MNFEQLHSDNSLKIKEMSDMATEIVRAYYDPIIGVQQNTYMLQLFQTPDAIIEQLNHGCRYYFLKVDGKNIGFMSFYPRNDSMYLSKWYMYQEYRDKGYGHQCLDFLIKEAQKEGLAAIELNVNRFNVTQKKYEKLGFVRIREEKNDIGNGYFMDDFVYRYDIASRNNADSLKTLVDKGLYDEDIKNIAYKVIDGQRISDDEAIVLYSRAELGLLGMLAFEIKRRKSGNKVFYNRNFHIEPTNVCVNNCKFCSYKKPQGDPQAWELSMDEILHRVAVYKDSKATEVHIVGGVHPDRDIEYYCRLMREVKKIIPGIVVKAFTAVELEYMINKAGLTIEDGLRKLIDSGLQCIPGGGAEIFDEKLRAEICPEKTKSSVWLDIHRTAHRLGISTNCTMLYGHKETYAQRVDHLSRLRKLQDETGGFSAFIPLKYRKENNTMQSLGEVPLTEDLRNYAVSRIYLDNFPHVKAYWVMSGLETTKLALQYGADDIDGTVNDSTKIYTMAGVDGKPSMTVEQIRQLIESVGLVPVERDTFYNTIEE
ncbi:MAG: aminofutalosine synthase MqnE [Bacteroidales bacterium]|nr:aminofutalosine synthase MqnE [Bacteroidales bacterium]